ncbi:MAG: AgmX/PglI C-terminal domain-containing protein [Bdellovibrionales bacterium]|nr:AgmX/PglI C-terminal domain-containing protein [Bdellovibrionales bacterium]
MAIGPNSLVQITCHKNTGVVYVPPVRLRSHGHQRFSMNGHVFSFAVRRIRGVRTAVVVDDTGEFALLNPDETIYFNRDGFTYAFLLADDFADGATAPFSSRLTVGLLFHLALVMVLMVLPFQHDSTRELSSTDERIDVARVKQVLDRVARRQEEKQRVMSETAAAPIAVPPVPSIPSMEAPPEAAAGEDGNNNSFLPPGFEGIRRRRLTQEAPAVAEKPPLTNNSETTLRSQKYDTASGLGVKGEGPGGGGGRGTGKGWGASVSGAGSISLALVEKALAQNRPQLLACYDNVLLNDETAKGKLLFSWVLSPEGEASDIKLLRTSFRGREFHLCLADVIKTTHFPAPQGGSVVIRYPFEFVQGGSH